jgi:DNA-binding response OmpR family regulator
MSPPDPATTVSSATGDVLVVDDNLHVAKALAVLLGQAGFEPATCHNGSDALAKARSAAPAAIVLDVHLPDINGLVLAQKLRTLLGPDVPIIIVSGDTSMETINSLSHVGATYFFPKPVNAAALIQRIRELLGR